MSASLGLHIGAVRFLGILAAALLAGAAVSFAGLLSFVGLLAPHIARRLVGNNHRILLPAAMLLGAALLCCVMCWHAACLLRLNCRWHSAVPHRRAVLPWLAAARQGEANV